jgi:hypothetical protein
MTKKDRRVRVRAVWRKEPDWDKFIDALILLATLRVEQEGATSPNEDPSSSGEASA